MEVGQLEATLVEESSPTPQDRGLVLVCVARQGLSYLGILRMVASLWRRVAQVLANRVQGVPLLCGGSGGWGGARGLVS